MRNYPRLIARLVLLACLAIIIPAAAFAASSSEESNANSVVNALADEPAPGIEVGADCRTASETGFDICDDSNGNFLTAYQSYGLQNVGYPISTRYRRDGFITQAFQKAILQWNPETKSVAFKNIFDELSSKGLDQQLHNSARVPHALPAGWDKGLLFEQVIKKREALLTRPALQAAYFNRADRLTVFGLPTSEVVDMDDHYAIRLQRTVLQEWKEKQEWAAAGEVTIANGGDIVKNMNCLPPFAVKSDGLSSAHLSCEPPPPPAPARKLDPDLDELGVIIQEANVAPGQAYWRVVEILWHDESEAEGGHNIWVDVEDENKDELNDQRVKFFWADGEVVEDSPANFAMYASGFSYSIQIEGLPSDVVRGMGLGSIEERDLNIHVEYFLKFRKTIK